VRTKLNPQVFANKLCIISVLISISFTGNSQNDTDFLTAKNELKINGLSTIVGYLEVSYDYILNKESSIGISTGFSFDESVDYKFGIIPNYRFFFGDKPASGFFIEANTTIFSQEEQRSSVLGSVSADNGKSYLGFGAGIAIGGKFISSKSGLVGELFIGGGRNFTNKDKIDDGYPRIGVSVGKRF